MSANFHNHFGDIHSPIQDVDPTTSQTGQFTDAQSAVRSH